MQALSMMMVISGSRCDRLQSCCHAPPYRVPSSYEGFKESGPEVDNLLRKSFVTLNPGVKLGKRNQVRIKRSWVKCYAQGASGEIQKKESGSQGCGLKPLDILSERIVPLKEGCKGEVGEHFNQPHGGMPGNEISNSEYQKIQDLRFSGDMWEGDSGPQVLDLQRALYWFGYLPKRTELTAYFGPETKRALQLFQIAHKVAGTGAWGSSSRQALWKLLNDESSSFSEGGSGVHSNVQQPGTTTFVNEANVGGTHVGLCVSELMKNMGAHSQEFMSTLSSAPCWRHLPMNVPRNAAMIGLLVGMLVALFGIGYTVVGMMLHDPHGQPVRRRLLRAHWRDDLTGTTTPLKPKRHLDMFPGLDLSAVGEGDYYESYRLRSKSRPTGRTDRLILYEGQVLVGDESHSSVYPFMNGRGSGKTGSQGGPSRARSSSILNGEASNEQVNQRPVSNGSVSASREESFRGSQISSKRTSNGRIRESKMFRSERSSSLGGNNAWQDKDEENFKDCVEELRKSVQAAEMKRQAAMRALSKERQRSLELQVKISRQKESAAALEEEVRVLKESHDALLASLRKKYSSSVAARAAAALLYQHWDTNYKEGSPQTLSY